MELRIARVGPIQEGVVKFGDVTLFMGKPNTGKSYALRLLYFSLLALDEKAAEEFRMKLFSRFYDLIAERARLEGIEEFAEKFIRLVAVLHALHTKGYRVDEQTLHYIVERLSVKLENGVVVTGSVAKLEAEINGMEIVDSARQAVVSLASKTLTLRGDSRVELSPPGLFNIGVDVLTVLPSTTKIRFIHAPPPSIEMHHVLVRVLNRIGIRVSPYGLELLASSVKFVAKPLEFELAPGVVRLEIEMRGFIRSLPWFKEPYRMVPSRETIDEVLKKVSRLRPEDVAEVTQLLQHHCAGLAARILAHWLQKSLASHLSRVTGLRAVVPVPYGRALVVHMLERAASEPFERTGRVRELLALHSAILKSYAAWASEGRAAVIEGRVDPEVLEAFKPLLGGELEAKASMIYYRDVRGAVLPVQLASALVEETTGILYAVAPAPRDTLLLIEEPEAQLHPSAQIAAALLLAALTAKGYRVVVTTHSDIIAVTLAYTVLKPSVKDIEHLLTNLGLVQGCETLARLAAEAAKTMRLAINHFTVEGRVEHFEAKDLLERVPGITETLDTLAAWAASLPGSFSDEQVRRSQG